MDRFPSGLTRYDFLDELSRLERASRFDETERNFFDEGPHLISSPELPWGDEVRHLSVAAYERFIHGETWITGGGAREMEADIVAWMGTILGSDDPAGFVTAGGSESNMCAVLTAKQRAGRKGGSIVFPDNGHYSLHKLCRMFDLDPIAVPAPEGRLDQVDPAAIEAAIRPDTIAIVATAGTWAYGSIDPIAEIGAIAEKHDLYLHVDGAFGGYILPFLEIGGYDREMPLWDFRVPGVCSISADLHKNGMAPPPASTLFFRDSGLLELAKEICPPNGTISGTRGTGPIAGAWTMVKLLGTWGYVDVAKKSISMRDQLAAGAAEIPGLLVHPGSRINMTLIHSQTVDLRPVVDRLRDRGWMFAVRAIPAPAGIVLAPMPHNEGQAPAFLDDLADAVAAAPAMPTELRVDAEKVSSYGF
ncbi:aminotransferase class V-fold PLP-dependent enzyme [Nocardioides marmoriginsengisoli]|uniref:Aminotransferase class V-fold PLP-dependent enzyme n=1 Tax=Nocardioides marmoriginsengisoli TaxID=661483 RepID=A0A3N0CHM2_9ACTN|nr:aminotransferase class V-fold PLP-dependent enzyme [Nocardioides marmoriginsengisoli]RNL62503.1 aminotransferase class V-fold PLP-dependent enzyme [Nocardioides marmoriginsengisoli]